MPTLQFKGKTAVETYHYTVPHHTFEFDPKLSVLGKGEKPSLDGNLIIEGDNLLALKALLPTHAGRIKCIYIDPPYNTGNEGWVYNDNLTQPQFKEWLGQVVGKEEEDACRHDKWCCMMYPRLQLLEQLLHEQGAIFVSIDENELVNLRLLMDEIFGPNNFVGLLIWRKKEGGGQTDEYFVTEHEYIAVYAKSKESFAWRDETIPRPEDEFPEKDARGRFRSVRLAKWGSGARKQDRPTMHFPLLAPDGKKILPKAPDGSEGRWRVGKGTMSAIISEDRLAWKKERSEWIVFEKVYLTEETAVKTLKARSILYDLASSGDGTNELTELFGRKDVFENPKPVDLVRFLIKRASPNDALILDSCAGSGTAAHAVLELNGAGGGNRKFILVQQPYDTKENEAENFNICYKITAERVRRVINGYSYKTQSGKEEKVAGTGGSFTYARLSAKPLFGEYRDFGENPPPYEEVARYVFYTETSRLWNPKGMDKKSGRIGEHNGASYFLLYSPNQKADWAIDAEFLKNTAAEDPNDRLVVYAEKIWLHRAALREWEAANGKALRTMIVPFNLL
jgi:adenine-specific DNA-methyltransferase